MQKNKRNKDVVLSPSAQWSLILFLGSFIVNMLSMWFIGTLSNSVDLPTIIILLPPFITIILYLFSLCLGVATLKTTKFPLVWVIPCLLMAGFLSFSVITEFNLLSTSTAQTIAKHREIEPGKAIGISVGNRTTNPTQVYAVYYNSPAERSGLKNGDIIVSIDGNSVNNRNDIVERLNQLEKSTISITVMREGQMINLKVNR